MVPNSFSIHPRLLAGMVDDWRQTGQYETFDVAFRLMSASQWLSYAVMAQLYLDVGAPKLFLYLEGRRKVQNTRKKKLMSVPIGMDTPT